MAVTIVAQVVIVSVWVLTGWVGAYWHVSFPMWSRSVWGMRAAYFPVSPNSRLSSDGSLSTVSSCHSPGQRRRAGSVANA